jgi:hypothetical protein
MDPVVCSSWLSARNAANDFAGVGGRVIGHKEGFIATQNQFTKTFVVKDKKMEKKMDLDEALSIVLSLAQENVIDDKLIDDVDSDGDMQDDQDMQNEACELVQRFLDINSNDDLAEKCGKDILLEFKKKTKVNRVDLRSGSKTPVGVTRTMFAILSKQAQGETF